MNTARSPWSGDFGRGKLRDMNASRARRRRFGALLIVVALLVLSLAVALVNRDELESMVVAPAPVGSPLAEPEHVSAEERAFYAYVGPRLDNLVAEGNVLAELGAQRSRNLVELKVRSDRVSELGDQIDAFLASTPIPPRLQPFVDRYREAMTRVRQGMDDAKAGVVRFDWNAVATGLDLFSSGVDDLADAGEQLRSIVAPGATPSPRSMPVQ